MNNRKSFIIIFSICCIIFFLQFTYNNYNRATKLGIVVQQIRFNPNNIDTWIQNTGTFDLDIRTPNTPGFQWPAGSGKFAGFTGGLTTGAYVNNDLRMASVSFKGEYAPGYISHSSGHPVAQTDSTFRFYKISRSDNSNSYDWQVWGRMVPYGAPFVDVNHNGQYEPAIDTPGFRGASQTIFICLTDGFPSSHQIGEGFGGGTPPLYAELHMTSWGYDNPGYQDMIFRKFELINRNDTAWNKTYTAIIYDADVGYKEDDYICGDSTLKTAICYNSDNDDDISLSPYAYGINPPAFGIKWLSCGNVSYSGFKYFVYFTNTSSPAPPCETDPNGELIPAYYLLKGLKKDQSSWLYPPGGDSSRITKFCYGGDPEAGIGWNEGQPGYPTGSIQNCGSLYGQFVIANPPGDRRIVMSNGSQTNTIAPNDTVRIMISELIARGNNNKNSVTKLKQLTQVAQHLCDNGFVIGINNISSEVPNGFSLSQNYPNPFNPVTIINYELPITNYVKLTVYDILGKEITVLVNEKQIAGKYSVEWDGTNYPSGVYFYKLTVSDASTPLSIIYSETKKMVLIK